MRIFLAILCAFAALSQTSTVIVVPADLVFFANKAATNFDANGGLNTFTAQVVTAGTTNVWGCWAATPFSATNRAKLNVLTNTPPFAGNVLVLDYNLTSQPSAPFEFLTTNGLAVYAPPLN